MANTEELSDSTWLAIQCDDRTFHVTYGTVNKCPNGLLATMASKRWNETHETTFRVEVDAEIMVHVMRWLRNQILPTKEYVDTHVLRATADFLGLESMIQTLDQVSEQEHFLDSEICAHLFFRERAYVDRYGNKTCLLYHIEFTLVPMNSIMETYTYAEKSHITYEEGYPLVKVEVPKTWLVPDRFPLTGIISENHLPYHSKKTFFMELTRRHWTVDLSRAFPHNKDDNFVCALRYSMKDAMASLPIDSAMAETEIISRPFIMMMGQ